MDIKNMPEYMKDAYVEDILKFEKRSVELPLLCQKAIALFGTEIQRIIAMEELSELIVEISKEIRGTGNRSNLIEEIVDVDIMMVQLKEMLFNEGHLTEYLNTFHKKVDRLEEIMENKEDELTKEVFKELFFK